MDISFILIEPAVPENIGASARAIKTMGFKRLCLVNPENHLNKKAKILAHASHDVLEDALVYQDFRELLSDFDFLIATSAKRRRTNENYLQADALPEFLFERKDNFNRVGILFGREESGLTNEEIRKCDLVTFIPMAAPYPSLNLSQAVMVYAYLLSGIVKRNRISGKAKSNAESVGALKSKVQALLEVIEIKQPHIIGPRIMERLSYLKKEDVSLLHSACNSILKKIRPSRQVNRKTSS